MDYFNRRRNDNDKEDWRTASVVRAIYASQGVKTKISDHLLQFEKTKPQQGNDSKSIWLALMGINPENPYE